MQICNLVWDSVVDSSLVISVLYLFLLFLCNSFKPYRSFSKTQLWSGSLLVLNSGASLDSYELCDPKNKFMEHEQSLEEAMRWLQQKGVLERL